MWARILEITPALEQCYRDFDQSQALPLDAQACPKSLSRRKPRWAAPVHCPTVQEALCRCLLLAGLTLRAGLVGRSGNSIAYSVDSWCVSKMPSCVRCVSAGGWQLDVDTPRCHPYHELISSPEARCAALRCASSEGCRSVHAAGGCGPPVQFGAAPYTCRVTASRCGCRAKPSCGGSCGVGRTRTRRSRTGRQSIAASPAR